MPKHTLPIAIVVCVLWGCGSSETEPPAEPSASAEPGAENPGAGEAPADEGETEPSEAPGDEATGEGRAVTVTRLSGTETAPATGAPGTPATATASVEGTAVVIALEDFVTYCAPAPTFTAEMEGDALVVQAVQPETPTRCIGPHSARLRLDGVPAGQHAVSVRNTAGEEVATGQVTVGG